MALGNSMKQRLFLIDGSGYIFRAYYAVRPLTTSKGLPTNALYGFTSMLLKLFRDEKPDHVAVVFDAGRKTFRNKLYPDYKANRAEPPEDLVPQFPYFRKIVQALNICCLEVEGFEADDVIGTVAKQLEEKNLDTVIITADKDLMQLVNDKITLWDTMRDRKVGLSEVKTRFQVGPEKVTDIFGLAGDTSDNIPGIPGIGEKTAMKLVGEYGSLESVLENVGKLKGKLKEHVEQNIDQARLSKRLATIITDVPVKFDFRDFELREPDHKELRALFEELEFQTLLSQLTPQKTLESSGYHLVSSEGGLKKVVEKCLHAEALAFDLETTSLDVRVAEIVGVALSCQEGEAYYVPMAPYVLGILRPLLENKKVSRWAQNAKYDAAVLKRYGIHVFPVQCDTMIASYLLHPEERHNLDFLAQKYLKHKMTTYEDVTGKGKKQINFSEVEVQTAKDYACEDADVTYRLASIFLPLIKKEGLDRLYEDIEMPLVEVLMAMETSGVLLDVALLKKLSKEYETRLHQIESRIFESAGQSFNINSPKQLGKILFEALNLPVIRKTKTGYSTDVDVLMELRSHHDIAAHILDYRSLSKLISTYIDALPSLVDPKTGRVHTSFNQTITATGRLSSSNPNLQNIPVRTDEGRRIREAFIAQKGCDVLSVDYSQIELRLLAHISEDPKLMNAFCQNEDIHRQTAMEVFDVQGDRVTPEMRSMGKTINFGILYGQTPHGLSQQLGISMNEASDYIRRFYEKFSRVKEYKEEILKEVHKTQMAQTLKGRRRHFPDINSHNANVRNLAERMAFNMIFQGSAADIIKKVMIEIYQKFVQRSLKSRMILQVHDELVFEVDRSEKEAVQEIVVTTMEGGMDLKVPLKVDVGWGDNWAKAH